MHRGAAVTRETGREAFTGEDIASLEDHSDSKVAAHASETEMPTSDGHLSSHSMWPQQHMSYNSADLSQDLSSAAPWRTAACTTSISTLEDNNYCTDTETSYLQFLPVCKEEFSPEHQSQSLSLVQVKLEPPQIKEEQQEMVPSLVQVKLEPPQIKEEQKEVLLRPEEASGSTLTLLAVKSEDDDENRDKEPPASTSTEHMKTQAYIEYWVPTRDDQLLSSHCSESDTEDSDEWETRDDESFSNTLKSHRTVHVEGQTLSNKLSQDMKSSKRTSLSQTVKKGFSCTECGKVFERKGVLNRHMRIHLGEKSVACTVCSKTFSQTVHLKTHMMIHTGENPFACTICSKSFNQSQNLKAHMRIHTEENPFACTICSTSFAQKGNLTKHMRIHTKEKPFACTMCSKSFAHNGNLTKHMRIHTGEKPFTCTICSKSFNQNPHLKAHMRLHTGETPFACTVCEKRFNRNSALKVHMETHTG